MVDVPSIIGQNYPDAGIDTNLFTVANDQQVQFSIFIANQASNPDRITIALIANGGTENEACYIASNTQIISHSVLAFSGLFLNSNDRVQVKSINGSSSFTATGIISTP